MLCSGSGKKKPARQADPKPVKPKSKSNGPAPKQPKSTKPVKPVKPVKPAKPAKAAKPSVGPAPAQKPAAAVPVPAQDPIAAKAAARAAKASKAEKARQAVASAGPVPAMADRVYPKPATDKQQNRTKKNNARLEAGQKAVGAKFDEKRLNRKGKYRQSDLHIGTLQNGLSSAQPGTAEHTQLSAQLDQARNKRTAMENKHNTKDWNNYKAQMPGVMTKAGGGAMTPEEAKNRLKELQAGNPRALNNLSKNRGENHRKVERGQKPQHKVINTRYAGRDQSGPGQDAAHQKAWNRATKREYGVVLSPDGKEAVIVKGQPGSVPNGARAVRFFSFFVSSHL